MQSKKSPIKKKVPKIDKVVELTEDLKRIQADFVNYKRRAEEDQIRSANSGKYVVVQQLLPVLDNVLRAISHAPEDLKDNDYVKGVQSIAKQIETALSNVGVNKIEALAADFDPQLMEAVSMEDGDGEREVVVEVLQEGYVMGEQVIRHAMVKVGRK